MDKDPQLTFDSLQGSSANLEQGIDDDDDAAAQTNQNLMILGGSWVQLIGLENPLTASEFQREGQTEPTALHTHDTSSWNYLHRHHHHTTITDDPHSQSHCLGGSIAGKYLV